MLSMTGFGEGKAGAADGEVAVQLAAVNNRTWSVHLRSDLHDLAIDEMVRQELKSRLVRGSLSVQVAWRPAPGSGLGIDLAHLGAAWKELAEQARIWGAPPPTVESVARLLPSGSSSQVPAASSTRRILVERALSQAIEALQAMRRREGDALARDLASHVRSLKRLHGELTLQAQPRLGRYRESLLERLREVLATQAGVTSEQVVREVAIHADRIDVSEELVRLSCHLDGLEALVGSADDALGRRLEFLLQECAREVSTTGAKANDVAMTATTIEAKYIIEQMKEQAANIA